jgi:hypothetical protein
MLPKNNQIAIAWIQKLIYGWLIFCIGGGGSLTYFDGFLPGHEHGEHPFHLSLLEGSAHAHHLSLSQSEVLTERMRFWLASRLNPQANFISDPQNLAPGFSTFFSSGLSDGYILIAARSQIISLPLCFGPVALAALTGQSAWLAPPEKPPLLS